MHESTMLFQVGNLYPVAQSLLVVAFATVLSAAYRSDPPSAALTVARTIAIFGLLLTACWLYVGHQQCRYNRRLQRHIRGRLPDYATTIGMIGRKWPSKPVIIYGVPSTGRRHVGAVPRDHLTLAPTCSRTLPSQSALFAGVGTVAGSCGTAAK